MANTVSKDAVIGQLEKRWDYLSARTVYSEWARESGASGDSLSSTDLTALADWISLQDRADHVADALRRFGGGGGGAAAPAKAEAPKKEEPKKDDKAPAKKASKKDDKPAEEPKDDKKDDKKGASKKSKKASKKSSKKSD